MADSTSSPLPPPFAYVAALLDASARRGGGWAVARCVATRLRRAALDRALALRHPQPGLIPHAERGVQDASAAYVARLESGGAQISMAARGKPHAHAKAQRFVKTLKGEEVHLKASRTFADAAANIQTFIADVYTTKRLHASVGYRPPVAFEAAFASGAMRSPRA